jgi:hypothetical protein
MTPTRKRILEGARERILAGRADLEAADRYEQLAAKTTDPARRADYLQRATEARAIGRSKLRSTV